MIPIITLILVIAFAFWMFWDTQSHEASQNNLLESGFQVDATLEGRPSVLFDRDDRKLAFVSSTRTTVYDYGQVLGWEWGSRPKEGYNAKSDTQESYYVVFYMQYEDEPTIRVEGLEEAEARVWQGKLEDLLGKGADGG